MTQIEALQQQVKELRAEVKAAQSLFQMVRDGCLQMAQAGMEIEERVSVLEGQSGLPTHLQRRPYGPKALME